VITRKWLTRFIYYLLPIRVEWWRKSIKYMHQGVRLGYLCLSEVKVSLKGM
jgi:hypothetical protein